MATAGSLTAHIDCPACSETLELRATADDLPTPDDKVRITISTGPIREHVAAAHLAAAPVVGEQPNA